MGEAAHCPLHQRYLGKGNSCTDCDKIQLALSYAQDIVNTYPTITLRTMGQMTKQINDLREALELTKSIKQPKFYPEKP